MYILLLSIATFIFPQTVKSISLFLYDKLLREKGRGKIYKKNSKYFKSIQKEEIYTENIIETNAHVFMFCFVFYYFSPISKKKMAIG